MLRAVFRLSGPARRFPADRSGATAIEYGLIVALIGIAILTAVGDTHDGVAAMFSYVMDNVVAALTRS